MLKGVLVMDVTLETDTDLYNKQIALEADMLTGGIRHSAIQGQ